MLVGCGFPHFDSTFTACHNPGSQYQNLLDRLTKVCWDLQFCNFLSPLENPKSLRAILVRTSPSPKYTVFVCERRCDIFWRLRPSEEDKIETALEVVGLEASSYRGGDLEGGFS